MTKSDIPQALRDHFPGISSYLYKRIVQLKLAYYLGHESGLKKVDEEIERIIAANDTSAGPALSAGGIASQRPAAEPVDQPDHAGD